MRRLSSFHLSSASLASAQPEKSGLPQRGLRSRDRPQERTAWPSTKGGDGQGWMSREWVAVRCHATPWDSSGGQTSSAAWGARTVTRASARSAPSGPVATHVYVAEARAAPSTSRDPAG
uniref:Putative secreted protein n=1 Tax=Ixodes ricinus TaxID=34613 RepID=A0A6B0ULZ5_IXORI